LLHLTALYGWYLMPRQPVLDIPVRALNIKLGDGEELSPEEMKAAAPEANNAANVENTISRLVRDDTAEQQQREQSMTHSMDKAMGNLEKLPAVPPKQLPPGKAKVIGKFNVRSEAP